MEQKKTRTEIYKNENPDRALREVIAFYGDEIPTSSSKNVRCPFHNDTNPSFNIKDGYFKCFSECGAQGDAFNYIMLKENCGFQEALNIAGEIFGTKEERKGKGLSKTELLDNFIKNNIKEFSANPEYKYEEHYVYKDENAIPVFIKIKFRHPETKDKTFIMGNLIDEGSYYKIDSDKKTDKINIFYNTHLISKAIKENKKIYIVEGEKDANTLTKLGFVAISCRNTKNLTQEMINSLYKANIVVVPDMDTVGGEHEKVLTDSLLSVAKSFRILKLYELVKEGKKDITDYVEIQKNKGLVNSSIKTRIEELTYSALDLKNLAELQQDRQGIKKHKFEHDKETGDVIVTPIHLTNFRIVEAKICVNEDTGKEDIEIVTERYKYNFSEKPVRKVIRGEVKDIFTDSKAFSQQLGMSMSWYGTPKDLITLKEWIDRYFLIDEKYEYLRVGIRDDVYIDGKAQKCLMTQSGALLPDGTLNTEIKAVTPYSILDIEGRKILSKEDANDLLEHMFRYTTKRNALNMWGSLVAGMLNPYYAESTQNPHILHIMGASGTGKSYVLENIIIPVLNTDYALSFMDTTPHALKLAFDATNIITLMDEVKPSKAKQGRMDTLSGAIRELTGSTKGLKGRKDQGANQTSYNSTLIIVGEEPIEETAIKNRSNIVVYTDITTTPDHIKHGEVLMTKEYREKLKDLGFTLYLEILKNWNADRINEMKAYILDKYPIEGVTKIRERSTYINTVMGLIILEDVLRITAEKPSLKIVESSIDLIKENILEHVLENGEGAKQNYELWLERVEELASTSDDRFRLDVGVHFKKTIEDNEECLAIALTDTCTKTFEHATKMGEKLESSNAISKLLRGSKYAKLPKTKTVKFKTSPIHTTGIKSIVLKMSELEKLNMNNVLEMARDEFENRK